VGHPHGGRPPVTARARIAAHSTTTRHLLISPPDGIYLQMAGVDGFETAIIRETGSEPPERHLPIIRASPGPTAMVRRMRSGACRRGWTAYVSKPDRPSGGPARRDPGGVRPVRRQMQA